MRDLSNDANAMFLCLFVVFFVCFFCFFLFFSDSVQNKAYVVDTNLNCIKLVQFKWVSTTYAFIEKSTYTGCNLKTTELLDCAL